MAAKKIDRLREAIEEGYHVDGASLLLGAPLYGEQCLTGTSVQLPLRMLNRHGLIAGATGTGKTKTLQLLAGKLSQQGVPCLLMDLKGDLSGIAEASPGHRKIDERHEKIGVPFEASSHPVELLSLTGKNGLTLRATVGEFGPLLFSQMLGLNSTQTGIMALLFKYCDDKSLPLVDLADVKKGLQYISGDGKAEVQEEYGLVSANSVGAIQRKILEVEQQGADLFFGEPSFDVADLLRVDEEGDGVISIVRLTDIQDRPRLFSSFMMALLGEVYSTFPEVGDLDKPKLCLFIDEAHLLFDKVSDELLEQLEAVVKLIRSKGVGLFFCTQSPADVPNAVLGQLGLKIQHAMRAFTAKDRKGIKLAAENYPVSDFYKTDKVMTELGIGEALVTALGEDGRPTPLVSTLLCAPDSRMGTLKVAEIKALLRGSSIAHKYAERIDRKTAHELLTERMAAARDPEIVDRREREHEAVKTGKRRGKSWMQRVFGSTLIRQIGRTVAREVTRGLLGVLGVKKR